MAYPWLQMSANAGHTEARVLLRKLASFNICRSPKIARTYPVFFAKLGTVLLITYILISSLVLGIVFKALISYKAFPLMVIFFAFSTPFIIGYFLHTQRVKMPKAYIAYQELEPLFFNFSYNLFCFVIFSVIYGLIGLLSSWTDLNLLSTLTFFFVLAVYTDNSHKANAIAEAVREYTSILEIPIEHHSQER